LVNSTIQLHKECYDQNNAYFWILTKFFKLTVDNFIT